MIKSFFADGAGGTPAVPGRAGRPIKYNHKKSV